MRIARTASLVACTALATACADPAGTPANVQLAFDVRALTSGSAALGNSASTLASVRLDVHLPTNADNPPLVLSRTVQITPTDSIVEMQLSLNEGPYRFSASAISNSNATLYFKSIVEFVDGSRPVVMNLDPVDGVFLAGPVQAGALTPVVLRNVGIRDVTWTLKCAGARFSCQNFIPPATVGRIPPGGQDSLRFLSFATDTLQLEFTSSVGRVVIQKALFATIIGGPTR